MLKKKLPVPIVGGGFALALCAGCINAAALMGACHQVVSHMSGPSTTLAIRLAEGDMDGFRRTLSVVVAFVLGNMISGFVIRQNGLRIGRRHGIVLVLESLVLFAALPCLRSGLRLGDGLAAIACGLQNGLAASYSGAVLRTTHVTGMVTDASVAFGHFLRGRAVDWIRMRLLGTLLSGFFLGGCLGAAGFSRFGSGILIFPALLTGGAGAAILLHRHLERRRALPAVRLIFAPANRRPEPGRD